MALSVAPQDRGLAAVVPLRLLTSGFQQVTGFKVSVRRSKQPRTACSLCQTVGDVTISLPLARLVNVILRALPHGKRHKELQLQKALNNQDDAFVFSQHRNYIRL
jgi:hypothetical protein